VGQAPAAGAWKVQPGGEEAGGSGDWSDVMTVLVRELRPGSWYLVIHHKRLRGGRIVRRIADTRDQAEKIAAELIRELQFRGYGALEAFRSGGVGSALTVRRFAEKWLEEIKTSGLRRSTVNSYAGNLAHHILPILGDLPLADVTYSRVKDWLRDRAESTYRRAPEGLEHRYSKDAIRIMAATLRALLEEAVREELIEENPVHHAGRLYSAAKRLRDDPDPFTLEELHRIEGACLDRWPQWYGFLLFQARTGARVGEAIALQWRDIDLSRAQAQIRRTMPIHRELGEPKTQASRRSVDLSPELVAALSRQEASQRAKSFKAGKDMPSWVFASPEGNAPDYSAFRRAFSRMQRRAGLRERRPHDLRHSYASLSLAAGKPLTYVSAQLGHRSPQITLQIYARWVPGTDAGAKDILDQSAATKRQQTATGGRDDR
jgi:integrase